MPEQRDSFIDLSSPEFQNRLAQSIAWCTSRPITLGESCCRTPALRPPRMFVEKRQLPDGRHEYDSLNFAEKMIAVREVAEKRAALLKAEGIKIPNPSSDLAGGRLLLFECDLSIWDGLSEDASSGFVDVYDIPGWDTWLDVGKTGRHEVLIVWVRPQLIDAANEAMAVNAVACHQWYGEHQWDFEA